jgi:hypothetical protein
VLFTFAERASGTGSASVEFVMWYCAEAGVGRPKDIQSTRKIKLQEKIGVRFLSCDWMEGER